MRLFENNLVNDKLLNIQKSAERMKKMVTELLDFRKLNQGALELRVDENELNSFISDIVENFTYYAEYLQVDLSYKKMVRFTEPGSILFKWRKYSLI